MNLSAVVVLIYPVNIQKLTIYFLGEVILEENLSSLDQITDNNTESKYFSSDNTL